MAARSNDDFRAARKAMVENQIRARGIRDPRVLNALLKTPRHLFVPPGQEAQAYGDTPLPIGEDQTISQPYIVAFMTEALHLAPGDKVLEIGTGSGYQAAVLSELAGDVYTIERIETLAADAAERLRRLGYANVHTRWGDGYAGWPEAAPFDVIMVTAAAPEVPAALKEQLAEGGRLIVPVGEGSQALKLISKKQGKFEEQTILDVRFVPMLSGRESAG